METLNESNGPTLFDPTLFVAATPASPLAPPAKGKAKKTRATSGRGYDTPLAFLDPVTRSWKMYEATCLLGELPSLEKLPPSGIAQNGVLSLRPPWEPITDATESSSWPTPRASAAMSEDLNNVASRLANGEPYKAKLEQAVALWPTPKSSDYKAARIWPIEKTKSRDMALRETIAERDPSAIGGRLNPEWVEWLMGFPTGWTDLKDSETPSSPK